MDSRILLKDILTVVKYVCLLTEAGELFGEVVALCLVPLDGPAASLALFRGTLNGESAAWVRDTPFGSDTEDKVLTKH